MQMQKGRVPNDVPARGLCIRTQLLLDASSAASWSAALHLGFFLTMTVPSSSGLTEINIRSIARPSNPWADLVVICNANSVAQLPHHPELQRPAESTRASNRAGPLAMQKGRVPCQGGGFAAQCRVQHTRDDTQHMHAQTVTA